PAPVSPRAAPASRRARARRRLAGVLRRPVPVPPVCSTPGTTFLVPHVDQRARAGVPVSCCSPGCVAGRLVRRQVPLLWYFSSASLAASLFVGPVRAVAPPRSELFDVRYRSSRVVRRPVPAEPGCSTSGATFLVP